MPIPEFPRFAPIGLEHKPEVDQAFSETRPVISEFTFTNLFIWRYCYNISISKMQGHILFLAQQAGKQPFFYPPWGQGDTASVVKNCLHFLTEKWGKGSIERVPQDYVEKYSHSLEGLEIIPDPDNDDYVYSSPDLILLRGRKYDGKRNAINKLQKEWSYEYRAIMDEELVRLCLELKDHWCIQRQCELYPGLVEEEQAIRELFANYKALDVKGGAIVMNGRVAAFSVGEQLNENTLVVHLEKADPAIRGLYAAMNQQFAQNEGSACEYINREQDLGDEGLKTAKQSYRPIFMVRKFKVRLKA